MFVCLASDRLLVVSLGKRYYSAEEKDGDLPERFPRYSRCHLLRYGSSYCPGVSVKRKGFFGFIGEEPLVQQISQCGLTIRG